MASWFVDGCFSPVFSHDRGREGSLFSLFYKDTNPIMGALVSWPDHLPKAPSPNTITLGERTQHMDFWAETQHLVHCGLSLS